MSYLTRAVDYQLDQLLPYVGAIAIDGLKGVGKQRRLHAEARKC